MTLILAGALGLTLGRFLCLIPGFSPMLLALCLHWLPAPFNSITLVTAYMTLSLSASGRDAVLPWLSGDSVLSAAASSGAPAEAHWTKLQGLALGLCAAVFNISAFSAGLGWLSLFILAFMAYQQRWYQLNYGAILQTLLLGGGCLAVARWVSAPFPIMALGIAMYALPAAFRSFRGTSVNGYGPSTQPRTWAAGFISGTLPGIPGGLLSEYTQASAVQASRMSGLAEGLAFSMLVNGGSPRTGIAIEALNYGGDMQVLWLAAVIAVLFAAKRLKWLEQLSIKLSQHERAPLVSLVLNCAALGLAGGPVFALVALAASLYVHVINHDQKAYKGYLLSAPAFMFLG